MCIVPWRSTTGPVGSEHSDIRSHEPVQACNVIDKECLSRVRVHECAPQRTMHVMSNIPVFATSHALCTRHAWCNLRLWLGCSSRKPQASVIRCPFVKRAYWYLHESILSACIFVWQFHRATAAVWMAEVVVPMTRLFLTAVEHS